jgi:hypothetical protein
MGDYSFDFKILSSFVVGYRSWAASIDPTCSFSLGLASAESRDSIIRKKHGPD